MKRGKKLFAVLLSLALVATMIPAFTMTAQASGTKTITGFWDPNGTGHIENVYIVTPSDDGKLTEGGGSSFTVDPGKIVTVTVEVKSGFSVSDLSLYVSGGYIELGEMHYQGNGIWALSFKMPDWEGSNECKFYIPTKSEATTLDMPLCYWDGDTIKWRAVSGAERYQMSMDQFLEGDSSLLFYADIDVNADGSVKDSSEALVVHGMIYKPIKDMITYDTSTQYYSFNYRKLVSIYSNGRYNFRMTAKKEPNITSEMFATEKTVTGEQLKNGYKDPIPGLDEDPTSKPNPFTDVFESDYYYTPVLWAYYHEPQITNGISATQFAPKNTVKRCECVTFLWRAMGCPEPKSTSNPFTDVKSDDYFYKPVLWAVENGITVGTTKTTFAPNETLKTAHMITFLYRTKNTGKDGWYEEAANWAADKNGKPFGVNLAVNNATNCPRGAVVTFLYELMNNGASVNQLGDAFVLYVEDIYKITSRGRLVTGRVQNGSIRTNDELVLHSYDSSGTPTETKVSALGIEMFKKILDEAEKGDNIGLLISEDGDLPVKRGDAVTSADSGLLSLTGTFIGTLERSEDFSTSLKFEKGTQMQFYYGNSTDITGTFIDVNGAAIGPKETRTGVSIETKYPVVWYVGQEIQVRQAGRIYGTFTITDIRQK